MRKYLNAGNIPLALAVFLATDNYDHEDDTVSATALLKPTRQLILADRLPPEAGLIDVSGLVKSRMGSAIHDSIEQAWLHNHVPAMKALGYPQRVIDKVKVNPLPGELGEDDIPVYLEQRHYKEFMGYKISGKFDFVAEGMVQDFKSTGVFTYMNDTKTDDYILQGSIYRWLAPHIITSDQMQIHFIFTDWQAARANEPGYPSQQAMTITLDLMSLEATEQFVANKLREIQTHKNTPEEQLPLCTDKELWRKEPEWKYYKNPEKMSRSTKNFKVSEFGSENAARSAAYARLAKDGNVGVVVEKPGEVVACKYCPAFPLCSQKDALVADGSLQL